MAVWGWEIFTRNEMRSQEWGVGFIMGELEVLKVSLHSWERGVLWRPPILPTPFNTHTHTHTHTHTYTQQALWERQHWKGLVSMK